MTSAVMWIGDGFKKLRTAAMDAWRESNKRTPFMCPECLSERTDFITGRLTGANGMWHGKATLRCKACSARWTWKGK